MRGLGLVIWRYMFFLFLWFVEDLMYLDLWFLIWIWYLVFDWICLMYVLLCLIIWVCRLKFGIDLSVIVIFFLGYLCCIWLVDFFIINLIVFIWLNLLCLIGGCLGLWWCWKWCLLISWGSFCFINFLILVIVLFKFFLVVDVMWR